MAIHELELDPLARTGEQRRPVSGKDRLHEELVTARAETWNDVARHVGTMS